MIFPAKNAGKIWRAHADYMPSMTILKKWKRMRRFKQTRGYNIKEADFYKLIFSSDLKRFHRALFKLLL